MVKRETDCERDRRMGGWDKACRFRDEHDDEVDVLHVEPMLMSVVGKPDDGAAFVRVWFAVELRDGIGESVGDLLDRIDTILFDDGRSLIRRLVEGDDA